MFNESVMFNRVSVTGSWLRGSTTLRGEASRMEKSCVRVHKELTVQYIEICFLCKTETLIQPVTPSESVSV